MFQSRFLTSPPSQVLHLSITDLLEAPGHFRTLQPKNHELLDFIGRHSKTLLQYAFSPIDDSKSKRAFLLLTNNSESLLENLVEDDLFFLLATEVLSRKDISLCHISRLATLFTKIALNTAGSNSVCFLFQLLPFVTEPAVFELFTTVCSQSPHLTNLQRILTNSSFAKSILKQLQSTFENDMKASLCRLIAVCLKHPQLHTSFANEAFFNTIQMSAFSEDIMLRNSIWQALVGMATDTFISKMVGVLPIVLEMFRSVRQLHSFHVFAFEFLSQLVRYAPACFDAEVSSEVLNVVLKLIFRFPEATHLQNVVFRFLRNAVKFDALLKVILNVVFPALVEEARLSVRNAVTANARSFLVDMEHSRERSKFVDRFLKGDEQFMVCEKEVLRKFMVAPKSGYGGPVVRRRCRSDGAERIKNIQFDEID